ncbi:MAG: helicase-related protein [Planctomycetaceae bacterium]
MHVFGLAGAYDDLLNADLAEHEKKALAGRFLIRRVTSVRVGDGEFTKNQYRREWRRGGVHVHDEPIRVADPRQRLIVALVQQKVSELLGHARFNSSFQIGMLASFESFLQTAKLKRDEIEVANFDDAEQTEDILEKEGIDVADVNRLARSYRKEFGCDMPHPKMDALVDSLLSAWRDGKKALVFVRRVASVKELKRKLDERYDQWLMAHLLRELPSSLQGRLHVLFEQYQGEKLDAESSPNTLGVEGNGRGGDDVDRGGYDSFFAWYFRGEGPRGVISGANIQQRFIQRGAAYATFFEDNYVAAVLGCCPGEVQRSLAAALGVSEDQLRSSLRDRSKRFLSRAKKHARADRYEAVQAAAIEWLKDHPGPGQEAARIVWHERFEASLRFPHASDAPDIGEWLELKTFFTELRQRRELCQALWPLPNDADPLGAFRQRELRAQLLSSAARLGHSLIDLYVTTICRLGSLELRAQETVADEDTGPELSRIHDYLDLLERQMNTPRTEREWGAFDELAEIAANFDLILDVNEPEARHQPLSQTARVFGQLLRQQQPVGGMSGQVNQTLVRQFRMPGYPLILISTDLLQEGEDLHTFCSSIHHYGISWTPSSMEQRIGRIDRVRSQSDRRLSRLVSGTLNGDDKLQVHFPHLEDTVEVLQVQRVLERMNVFLRLMHEGLITSGREQRTINASQEFATARRIVPQILERLESAFPVRPEHLRGSRRSLAVASSLPSELSCRFARLARGALSEVEVSWEPQSAPGRLAGTARLGNRVQPFTLLLDSVGAHPVVRCISPVGSVGPGEDQDSVVESARRAPVKIGAILTAEDRTYDLTVESEVVLAATSETDAARVGMLVRRVVSQADVLEQQHLPGVDEVLDTFREDLMREGTHG